MQVSLRVHGSKHSAYAHLLAKETVTGSNPVIPIYIPVTGSKYTPSFR